jgi:hypothetical protein
MFELLFYYYYYCYLLFFITIIMFDFSLLLRVSRGFFIVAYVNRHVTLHFFLNVCTVRRPSTVLTALSVYLTCLAALNVYSTCVLQYNFLPFFDTMLSVVNLGNIVLHRHYRFIG